MSSASGYPFEDSVNINVLTPSGHCLLSISAHSGTSVQDILDRIASIPGYEPQPRAGPLPKLLYEKRCLDNSCLLTALGIRTQIDLTYVQIVVPKEAKQAALHKFERCYTKFNDEETLALESVVDIVWTDGPLRQLGLLCGLQT